MVEVGNMVGDCVGASVGHGLGDIVGNGVGCTLGSEVGRVVGAKEGGGDAWVHICLQACSEEKMPLSLLLHDS
jgi:hypothetical protein